MITIKISTFIYKKNITKVTDGIIIFEKMKFEYNQNSKINGFILDFSNIKSCNLFVFKEIIDNMQNNLNGNYKLELINANELIISAFKMAIV